MRETIKVLRRRCGRNHHHRGQSRLFGDPKSSTPDLRVTVSDEPTALVVVVTGSGDGEEGEAEDGDGVFHAEEWWLAVVVVLVVVMLVLRLVLDFQRNLHPAVSQEELRKHDKLGNLWISIQGKVYDVTD